MTKFVCICLFGLVASASFTDEFFDRFATAQIKLTPSMSLEGSGYAAYYVFADALPNGDTVIAWNKEKTAYIKTVNSTGADKSSPFSIPGFFITELKTFGSNQLHVLAFEIVNKSEKYFIDTFNTDLALYYFRLDLKGSILVKTPLVGGKGIAAGAYWHFFQAQNGSTLQFNGDAYGVYATLSHNFGTGGFNTGIHQGEFYTALDRNGKKIAGKDQYFKVSHSWGALSARIGQDIFTFTAGDSSPFGLVGINRTNNNLKILWPQNKTAAQLTTMGDTNYLAIGAGQVFQAESLGSDSIALLVNTNENLPLQTRDERIKGMPIKVQNLLMMYLDKNLAIKKQKWLTKENRTIHTALFLPTGDGSVLLYTTETTEANPSITLLDTDLNQIAPAQINYSVSIEEHSRPFKYPNGTIGWLTTQEGGNTASLHTYKPSKTLDSTTSNTSETTISVSGSWETSFNGDLSNIYSLNLAQNGTKASGTYNLKDGKMSGNILKTGDSTWLIGTWTQTNSSGWFKFEFKNGSNFTGTWGYGNSGKTEGQWNGTKLR